MATLGMILRTMGLRLQLLALTSNGFGVAGMQSLSESLGCVAAPSLRSLSLTYNQIGPSGAEALAAALRGGAMPKLEELGLYHNPIGNQGVAALGAPLRKLPALKVLTSHTAKSATRAWPRWWPTWARTTSRRSRSSGSATNKITDAGAAKLVAAIDVGGLPKLVTHDFLIKGNAATAAAVQAVKGALAKRSQCLQ